MNFIIQSYTEQKEHFLKEKEQSKKNIDIALNVLKVAAGCFGFLTIAIGSLGYFRKIDTSTRAFQIISGCFFTGFISYAVHAIQIVTRYEFLSNEINNIDKKIVEGLVEQSKDLEKDIASKDKELAEKTQANERNKSLYETEKQKLISKIRFLSFENETLKNGLFENSQEEQNLPEIEEIPRTFTFKRVENQITHLFLNESGCIEYTSDAYQKLAQVPYFKKVLDWENTHRETPTRLKYLILNMNIYFTLDQSNKCKLQEVIRLESNLTTDPVALKHMDKKIIEAGLNFVVENIKFVHEIDDLSLLTFWEEILLANITLSICNMGLVEELMRLAQELGLQQILLSLIRFFTENYETEGIRLFLENLKDDIGLDRVDLNVIKDIISYPLLKTKINVKIVIINTLFFVSVVDLSVLGVYQKVNEIIFIGNTTNRFLKQAFESIVAMKSIKKIDLSRFKVYNNYKDNCWMIRSDYTYEECEKVFADAGFQRAHENVDVFTRG